MVCQTYSVPMFLASHKTCMMATGNLQKPLLAILQAGEESPNDHFWPLATSVERIRVQSVVPKLGSTAVYFVLISCYY
jgi:hypothetical protein